MISQLKVTSVVARAPLYLQYRDARHHALASGDAYDTRGPLAVDTSALSSVHVRETLCCCINVEHMLELFSLPFVTRLIWTKTIFIFWSHKGVFSLISAPHFRKIPNMISDAFVGTLSYTVTLFTEQYTAVLFALGYFTKVICKQLKFKRNMHLPTTQLIKFSTCAVDIDLMNCIWILVDVGATTALDKSTYCTIYRTAPKL